MQIEAEDRGDQRVLRCAGRWTVQQAPALEPQLARFQAPPAGPVVLDGTALEALDLTGAWLLRTLEQRLVRAGCQVGWQGERPALLGFIDQAMAGGDAAAAAAAPPPAGLERGLHELGRVTLLARGQALDLLAFLGALASTLGAALRAPRRLRLASIVRHVHETGVTAIPIVALIAFLISVIIAYIGAQQLRRFGGEIFIVDLVTIAVLRELGVLLTAVIVAGRSGSAFAAELGVMQLNDEVDALRAIGMDPVEVLVVPRVLGLMIALPALTVIADAMGLAGGALLSWTLVDLPLAQYLERMQEAISATTVWVGLVKAPVFAFLVALIGTLRGLQVRGSARELGRLTTMAVVQAIFLVILADAVFAVIFMELDL